MKFDAARAARHLGQLRDVGGCGEPEGREVGLGPEGGGQLGREGGDDGVLVPQLLLLPLCRDDGQLGEGGGPVTCHHHSSV